MVVLSQLKSYCIAGLLLGCALFGGCSQETKIAAPKFTGRLLLLTGDPANGADLAELTAAGEGYDLTTIASGVVEAVPSPDQTQLLYAIRDEILLRDLQSGAVKPLIKGASFCLAWAPDGKHFAYKQKDATSAKLYVSNLEGNTALIWEDSSVATSSCAQWIAPDRIVFDRLVGVVAKPKTSEALKPNTTTIRTVGDTVVKGVDTQRKWSIQGICPSGSAVLTPADESQPILIAKSVEHFETVNPSPGPSEGRFVGFAAQSCVPFFVQQSMSTSTELFSLNPKTWEQLRSAEIKQTFSPTAKMLIKSTARLMIVGDAPNKLFLIDTESGDVIALAGKSVKGSAGNAELISPVPVLWIEK